MTSGSSNSLELGNPMTATDYVLILSAFGVVAVNIITALRTNAKVKETHDAVNSRMEKFLNEQKVETERLLKLATTAAHAEGVKQMADTQAAAKTLEGGKPAEVKVINAPTDPVPTVTKP